jgi:hypothetical protein
MGLTDFANAACSSKVPDANSPALEAVRSSEDCSEQIDLTIFQVSS